MCIDLIWVQNNHLPLDISALFWSQQLHERKKESFFFEKLINNQPLITCLTYWKIEELHSFIFLLEKCAKIKVNNVPNALFKI